jgi:2-iminoacetate synthase
MIIDEKKIHGLLNESASPEKVREILQKALELKGLDLDEVASLLNVSDPDLLQELFYTAKKVKDEIYGKRLVLFTPLYISNYCSNDCLYCGFRVNNKTIERKELTIDEIKEETLTILEQGHKRVLILLGETREKDFLDYLIEAIDAVYSVRDSKGSYIRRINIEIAPLSAEGFQKIKDVQLGTYTVFQETYHKETYHKVHPTGKKHDYEWRIETMDRALSNGMHDVGIGALFGLYDYRFEVMALLEHARYLDETYGVGPHTISVPRLKPADNAPASIDTNHSVSDTDFKKLIAILRCAVPYTGIILSTRESAALRSEIFNLGVSQISAGSVVKPGGYKQGLTNEPYHGQFSLNDTRKSGEVIRDIIQRGFIPSFCTACYRLGRVGSDFMDLAKPGLIKTHCQPNGLMTLKEYLVDYADSETREIGEQLISKELDEIPNHKVKQKTIDNLRKIEAGKRDIYF